MLPWVLVPGTLCTEACFSSTLTALAAEGIEPLTSTYVPGDTADAIEEAKRLLGAAPPRFIVCAFSLGGLIAFQAALAAPERIAGMILISVNGRADQPGNAVVRRAQVTRAGHESIAVLVRESLWPKYVAAAALHDHALRREIEAMAVDTDLDRFANQAEIAIDRPNHNDLLSSVYAPVLVISGKADLAVPPDCGAEIAQALPNGHHSIIDDAGHFVLMEQAQATARAIVTWLRSATELASPVPDVVRQKNTA